MGFIVYLGLLVEVGRTTSISTILLIDVEVRASPPYIYPPTPWLKHTNTMRKAPSLGILDVVKRVSSSFVTT
jgi:hypothetical protein